MSNTNFHYPLNENNNQKKLKDGILFQLFLCLISIVFKKPGLIIVVCLLH